MIWQFLTNAQYNRLANCRSKKADICNIAKCYMVERQETPENAFVMALEHIGANNQFIDFTPEEENEIIKKLIKFKNMY